MAEQNANAEQQTCEQAVSYAHETLRKIRFLRAPIYGTYRRWHAFVERLPERADAMRAFAGRFANSDIPKVEVPGNPLLPAESNLGTVEQLARMFYREVSPVLCLADVDGQNAGEGPGPGEGSGVSHLLRKTPFGVPIR